jgi:hypothetical protein
MNPVNIGIFQTIIIIIVISYIYFKKTNSVTKQKDIEIGFNVKNIDFLTKHFYMLIKEKIRLLESGQMAQDEWIDEMKKGIFIKVKGQEYYYTVYQKIPDKDNTYICRVNHDAQNEGMSFESMINKLHYEKMFSNFSPDEKLIDNIYQSNSSLNTFDYYSLNSSKQKHERKRMIANKFDDGKGYSGTIGIGLSIEDLSDKYRDYYINCINKYAILATIVFTLILTILVSKISASMSFLYFTIIVSFITYYLGLSETFNSAKVESDQIKDIESSILSLTFFSAITIFLLSKNINLKDVSKTLLKSDYPFLLFTVSGLYILFSMFKMSDHKDLDELKSRRLTKQYLFNYSIIINIVLIIHFLISHYSKD